MTNHPNRGQTARWINRLKGLSDEPMRRAAQIALVAIDETLSNGSELTSETPLIAAYDALQAALVEPSAKPPESAMRYRVTWRGQYLFHVYGTDGADALEEARRAASRTMRQEVVHNLIVSVDP